MGKRIRVLFVFQSLEGRGPERIALNVISHLDPARFEPIVWILKPDNDLATEVPDWLTLHVALKGGQRLRHHLPGVLASLLRQARQADLIISIVELLPTYLAYLAGVLTRRPVIGWVRNAMDRVYADFPRWNFHVSQWVYRHLDHVVCVSAGVRQTLAEVHALSPGRLQVIYNAVNLRRIRALHSAPLPPCASAPTPPIILGVGRLVDQKGFDLLIEAHARLQARGVVTQLVLLGKGEREGALRALARRLGVEASVHFEGFQANPYPYMRRATVFALSSRYEGLGGVVIEAMACGLPVVAFECPSGPAEMLAGGQYGLLVPPLDVEGLVEKLALVLQDEGLREHLRQEGLLRAQDFIPETIMPQWEALIARVAARTVKP